MKNLVANPNADDFIADELRKAGIPIITIPQTKGELSTTMKGKLSKFDFRRAWGYWMVSGPMPLKNAEFLYSHAEAKNIRVDGHCCNIKPEDGLVYWDPETKRIPLDEESWQESMGFYERHPELVKSKTEFFAQYRSDPNPESYPAYVTGYHIDSELGLYVYAEEVRKLKDEELPDIPSFFR